MTRLAILTAGISPYHDARYRGAAELVDHLAVIATRNDCHSPPAADDRPYTALRLFKGRSAYARAVESGQALAATTAALERYNPDVVAAAGWHAAESLAAITWTRCRRRPLVVMSESQADDAGRTPLREAVKKRIVSQFDAALVGGPPQADYIRRLGIPGHRIHQGYNVVDNDHFARGALAARAEAERRRAQHGLPRAYVLASARFVPKKNLVALVRAYAAARRSVAAPPDLVILGEGPERTAIEAAIAAEGICCHVHLPGFKRYEALPVYYGLAEGFVHVSIAEQWGLVVNEAMASGLPVVVSRRCGAARTLVAKGGGIPVDPDPDGIAAGLTALFTMPPERRAAMGAAAARSVAAWGPRRFADGMRAAIASAQAAPRRGALAPWDAAIVRHLQTRIIDNVA